MSRRLFALSAPSVLVRAPRHMLSSPTNLGGYQVFVISGELVMIVIWLFVMFVF
jgi:hypothetical protein